MLRQNTTTMNPITRISFTSGHVYEVPTEAITGTIATADWERDILPHAKLVEFTPPKLNLSTATVTTSQFGTQPLPPNTGSEVIDSTVEWLLAISGAHG